MDLSHDQLVRICGGSACAATVGSSAAGGGLIAGLLSKVHPVRNGLIAAGITGLVSHLAAPSCQRRR